MSGRDVTSELEHMATDLEQRAGRSMSSAGKGDLRPIYEAQIEIGSEPDGDIEGAPTTAGVSLHRTKQFVLI